jgi:hypothetical protein
MWNFWDANKKIKIILTQLTFCPDMDGYAWEGFQWVDGWPVTPPRPQEMQQNPVQVMEENNNDTTSDTPADTAAVADTHNIAASSHVSGTIQVKSGQESRQDEEQGSTAAGSVYTGTSYATSQLSDSDEDVEDSSLTKLGSGYTQCRAAREAAMTVEVTDITCNENALTTERKKGYRVGTMDKNLNHDVANSFKGARIEKNGNLVNQFLSCSFDPSTHICITCSSEHSIWGGGEGSECFVLSDQNFVAALPGCEGKDCLKIMRLENPSLTELASIFLEIMDKKTVKPGTCVLVTSLSHLSRVGAAAYAAEWRIAVNMLVSRWAGVLVCPVFPLHFSEIPGPLFGELLVLHSWYKKMYSGTNQGLHSAWERYCEILLEFAEDAGSLDQTELRTPPSPVQPGSQEQFCSYPLLNVQHQPGHHFWPR